MVGNEFADISTPEKGALRRLFLHLEHSAAAALCGI
jgi:hypothetical protein